MHVFVDGTPLANLDVPGIFCCFDSVAGGVIGPTRFTVIMGISLAFTRHSSPKEVFRRGVRIGIVGFVLIICRYLIPSLIGFGITGDAGKFELFRD